jgi:hypothetical protein
MRQYKDPQKEKKSAAIVGLALAASLLDATAWPVDKPEVWTEVRAPHFLAVSNAGASQARRVAGQFEQFRAVFQMLLPKSRVDSGAPPLNLSATRRFIKFSCSIPKLLLLFLARVLLPDTG